MFVSGIGGTGKSFLIHALKIEPIASCTPSLEELVNSQFRDCSSFLHGHGVWLCPGLNGMYIYIVCTPDKWTTLVSSKIGPLIQLVNISDLTYTMYILYSTTLSMTCAFYLVDNIE